MICRPINDFTYADMFYDKNITYEYSVLLHEETKYNIYQIRCSELQMFTEEKFNSLFLDVEKIRHEKLEKLGI